MDSGKLIPCPDCARTFAADYDLKQHVRMSHGYQARSRMKKPSLLCPTCGGAPKTSEGRFGMKAECCGLWSWKGKPLVSRETHAARIKAHDVFDRLWKSGQVSRGECYRRLQIQMGLSSGDCHIALMTAEQAMRVVEIVAAGWLTEEMADA